MTELWKDVKGFEGYYQVSNFGNVKRVSHTSAYKKTNGVQRISERLKVLGTDKDGYKTVMLYIGSDVKKLCKVHRLVAEAFIPNPCNYPMVNHKDESKDNNCVSNLEWCDCTYNNNYGTRNQRLSKSKKGKVPYPLVRDSTTNRFVSPKNSRFVEVDNEES